jgi:hypothetical protein
MSVSIAKYSHHNFNSQHDFNPALRKFDAIDGNTIANRIMKDLFRKYGVDNILGLALLHKHSPLQEGERMTDIRGTSSPLSFEIGQASTWGFDTNAQCLVPLEFSISDNTVDWKQDTVQKFLAEFFGILADHQATDVLGLCVYPGDGYPGRVEFTIGRSNVNLTPDEVSAPRSLRCEMLILCRRS